MTNHEPIHSEVEQFEDPFWDPLVAAIGEERAGWFMWMCQIRLDDGVEIHDYKHIGNRQHLHIGTNGRLYWFVGPSSYLEVRLENVATM